MKVYVLRICLIVSNLLFLLAACSAPSRGSLIPTDEQMPPSSTPTDNANRETTTPSLTYTAASSATIRPTATIPTPTNTLPIPTPTNTFTPLPPTWTPQPTLNPDAAQNLLNILLENNGGCQLPCYWGITPGQTSWQEAISFLETFTMFLGIVDKRAGLRYAYFQIPFPLEIMGTIAHTYVFKNDIVDQINAFNGDLSPAFYLTSFLSTYGTPSEVWIRTEAYAEYSFQQPFEIALFYPDQGILMLYSGGSLQTVGDKLRNCLGELKSPFIYLWFVSYQRSFQECYEAYLDYPGDFPFLSLEEATGMDAATFYERFKEPGNTACLETPLRLWPGGQ